MKKKLSLLNILEQGPFVPASVPEVGYTSPGDTKAGSVWSGDFNSNASKQSWGEFLAIWVGGGPLGPPIAVARELSSWHGERELKYYDHPWQMIPELAGKLPVPENYDVWLIRSGMEADDFINGVKRDENNLPYYEYGAFEQKLKLYLPSSKFFNKYVGMPYKIKTEEGQIYCLHLDLNMKSNQTELQVGSDKSKDTDFVISLQNLKPDEGNGWFFAPPTEISKGRFEYFTKIGSSYYDYASEMYMMSTWSSFRLFWEKWGIITQIVVSIVIAYFTGGLSAFIEGVFFAAAEAEALAGGAAGFTRMYLWLTAEGSFVTTRSMIIAEFILEMAVNVPAALIDLHYDNRFGAILGIFFCFFPFLRSYGKLGRFIEGSYNQNTIDGLVTKILAENFSENITPEQMIQFIEKLTAEEKMAWAAGLKALSKKEGAEAFKESFEDMIKNAVKDGKLPSKFDSWLAGGKGSGFLKTTALSITLMADFTAIHGLVQGIIKLYKDPRDLKEIFFDSESKISEIKNKFPQNEKDNLVKTKKTEEIIKDYLISLGEKEQAEQLYQLSTGKNDTFFLDLVANEKIKEIKDNLDDYKKLGDKTKEALDKIKEANKNKKKPIPEEEIYSWFETGDTDETVKNVLAVSSSDEMNDEISQVTQKYKCLATNFKYDDGYDFLEENGTNGWVLTFQVTKPITITTNDIQKLNLAVDSYLSIYNNNTFQYNGKNYTKFSCK